MKIDMWYGDKIEPGRYTADAFFSPCAGVYRGNIYSGKKIIGDYECADSVKIGKAFKIDWL